MKSFALLISTLLVLNSSVVRAEETETSVASARMALADCVKKSTRSFRAVGSLSAEGITYFVGLACSGDREAYLQSIQKHDIKDVSNLMSQIDARIVAYVLYSIQKADAD